MPCLLLVLLSLFLHCNDFEIIAPKTVRFPGFVCNLIEGTAVWNCVGNTDLIMPNDVLLSVTQVPTALYVNSLMGNQFRFNTALPRRVSWLRADDTYSVIKVTILNVEIR
jgi:hypothetical protein